MSNTAFLNKAKSFRFNGNTLKVLAVIFMAIDHIGHMLFPSVITLRIIGRLSFPIFAFMIAEGCHYTKNKLKYFLSIFILGSLCQIAYYFYNNQLEMGILITFSLSILIVYILQYTKQIIFSNNIHLTLKVLSILFFLAVIACVFLLNMLVKINYGFWGCLAPAFASLIRKPDLNTLNFWKYVDNNLIRLLFFSICLILISITIGGIQYYSLLSILLLLLYSEKRGKANLKYFFYIFYPLHLIILQGIALLAI